MAGRDHRGLGLWRRAQRPEGWRHGWNERHRRSACKRGIAANTAPGAAFYPAVRWWTNWSLTPSGGNTGIEFVPMIWGSSTVNGAIPAGARYLLGFNEPNFMSQANLTPQAAAAAWPMLQANGRKAGSARIPSRTPS